MLLLRKPVNEDPLNKLVHYKQLDLLKHYKEQNGNRKSIYKITIATTTLFIVAFYCTYM